MSEQSPQSRHDPATSFGVHASQKGESARPLGAGRGIGPWLIGALVFAAALGAAFWLGRPAREAPTPSRPPPTTFPVPPLSSSPFRNTGLEARYVGSESCTPCHKSHTASFRSTGMGCSMAEADPANEPADALFDHPLSRRRYQIVRKAGALWHRELRMEDGAEKVLAEQKVKYVVGSGRHARTYLAEAEGFLVESPLTYYESRKAWGMSPGYDRADHMGFARGVGEGCLICHAGHVEAMDRSLHRIRVVEAAISCERCHGPGSLHVERHTAKPAPELVEIDHTIVNPVHLPRDLAEAVCQQCHLHGAASVLGRGRKITDFRPGLPLPDFRQDYWLEVDNKPMTVVGHVEQMHLSRCYQESATFTCTTCHNPHAFPGPEKQAAHYRAVCVSCHQPEKCTVDEERRARESPQNHCVQCHMPSSPTDIPHVSFTHHRVAVHERFTEKSEKSAAGRLRLFFAHAKLGKADRQRSLGLAYLGLAKEEKHPGHFATYRGRAFDLLTEAHAAGLRDPALEANLARLHFERESYEAQPLADGALRHADIAGVDRCTALFVSAAERFKRGQHEDARAMFRQLTTLRRHPHDWLLLADCEKILGNAAAASEARRAAARIDPQLGDRP